MGGLNPFDPAGLFGGGGPADLLGGGGGGDGGGVTILGGGGKPADEDAPLDVSKAYGFGVAGTGNSSGNKFNEMRRKQMGMGGNLGG